MAVIFAASATPGEDLPNAGEWDTLFKKGGHLLGYALLGAAYLRGRAPDRRPDAKDVASAVLLAALYGVSDELHQRFTPGRSPSLTDVGIDTLGAAVGAGLRGWWKRRACATGRT
jgi:VanZ family protein